MTLSNPRPSFPSGPATTSPSTTTAASQLTPEASSSSEGGDVANTAPAPSPGRGQTLSKLQTDLLPVQRGGGLEQPTSAATGSPHSHTENDSDSIEFEPESDEDDYADDGHDIYYNSRHNNRYRRRRRSDQDDDDHIPVSRSYTPDEEKRVVQKFDRRLTLFVAVLYMLAFLDRSNIGNAKIAGLAEDLRLSSSQYEWVLTAFYVTYIVFEWMTLMYRLVPAHVYISVCACAWGLFASFQCLVTSFWPLCLLRALLGLAEAAFAPGLPFYLSFFYKREEQAFRTGLVVSAAPLATSFAGSLAWVITWASRNGPIAPWRALFLLEGFPSVLVALVAWAYIPDGPGKALYLTPRERKVAKLRLKSGEPRHRKQLSKKSGSSSGFDRREIGRTLCDPKAYLTAFMFFSCNVAFSSLPVFLPTILNDMGYSTLTSQGLSAPPYLFSFFVVLLTASLSDRHRARSPYIIVHALISAAAYTTIALVGYYHLFFDSISPTFCKLLRYACVYPAAAGFFSAITLIITWTMDNQRAKEGKGTGMAILNLIGQCGPLLGARLYPTSDGPWYVAGMGVCAVAMVIVAALALGLRVLLQRENARSASAVRVATERAEEAERLMGGSSAAEAAAAGAGEEKTTSDRFVYIT